MRVGDGWRPLETAGDSWRRLETVGDGWSRLEAVGDGSRRLETVRDGLPHHVIGLVLDVGVDIAQRFDRGVRLGHARGQRRHLVHAYLSLDWRSIPRARVSLT